MLNNDLSAKKDSKKGDYGDGRGGGRLISFVICIAISEHHNVFLCLTDNKNIARDTTDQWIDTITGITVLLANLANRWCHMHQSGISAMSAYFCNNC